MLKGSMKPYDKLKDDIKEAKFPIEVELSKNQIINDVPYFIASHISILDNNPGKKVYLPYYMRLKQLLKHKL